MGLSEMPHPTIHSRKRCRNEDAPSFTDPSPPNKQPWLESPLSQSHHLTYLEELESSLDASTLESPTPEDLVTEMMRSLESVIVDMEELSAVSETLVEEALILETEALATLPEICIQEAEILGSDSDAVVAELASEALDLEPAVRTSPDLSMEPSDKTSPDLSCAGLPTASSCSHAYKTDRTSEAGVCCHGEVDIQRLLDVSDDELGIPAASSSGIPDNKVSADVSDDDWSLLDESCSDSAGAIDTSQQDGGLYAQFFMGGWLDNDCGFGPSEEGMFDFVGGVTMLDGYM